MISAASQRPLKVLLLNAVAELGGAERVLLDIIESCRKAVEFEMVCLGDGPLAKQAESIGCRVRIHPLPAQLQSIGDSGSGAIGLARSIVSGLAVVPSLPGWMIQLNAAIEQANPDIIHSNSIKTHLLAPWLRRGRSRLVWHIHDLIGRRPFASNLVSFASRRVDAAIAISNAVKADFASLAPHIPSALIYNGVDPTRFKPAEIDHNWLDFAAGAPPLVDRSIVRVGLVATYARWKGQDVFIQAIARLPPAIRRLARFYVVGGPIYRTASSQWSTGELQQLIDANGLRGQIVLVPFQSNAVKTMQSLDVMVHASTAPEPFGRTIIEAMSAGCATIVSLAGGAKELINPGIDALGFELGNVQELTDSLTCLLTESGLRQRIAAAGRKSAISRFSLERFGKQCTEFYNLQAGRPLTAL